MTKRLLALFLVCILAIPIMAVPVSATTYTGEYDYSIWYELSRIYAKISDYLPSISSLLDSIGNTCDTIWTEIRNLRVWLEGTMYTALDTINSNIIGFNNNVKLWIQAMTEDLAGWLEVIDTNITGFVETFFSFWEDWADKITGFKDDVVSWFSQTYTLIHDVFAANDGNAQESWEQDQISDSLGSDYKDNMEIIQDETRPTYEDLEIDPDSMAGGEDIGLYTDYIAIIFWNYMPFMVLFMSMMFSAVSFVIFGKR